MYVLGLAFSFDGMPPPSLPSPLPLTHARYDQTSTRFVPSRTQNPSHAHARPQLFKLLLFVSWRTLGFWDVVSVTTDSLLTAAFALRVAGIVSSDPQSATFRLRAFQCLSFVAPLIW